MAIERVKRLSQQDFNAGEIPHSARAARLAVDSGMKFDDFSQREERTTKAARIRNVNLERLHMRWFTQKTARGCERTNERRSDKERVLTPLNPR